MHHFNLSSASTKMAVPRASRWRRARIASLPLTINPPTPTFIVCRTSGCRLERSWRQMASSWSGDHSLAASGRVDTRSRSQSQDSPPTNGSRLPRSGSQIAPLHVGKWRLSCRDVSTLQVRLFLRVPRRFRYGLFCRPGSSRADQRGKRPGHELLQSKSRPKWIRSISTRGHGSISKRSRVRRAVFLRIWRWMYPSYFGLDERMEPVTLLTDFRVSNWLQAE